ncbi:siderophore-interacting protein [Halarcobacter mediterraneus]|uniref:Siderophore-interacting protein n=1 Tax=Halarcobacter mediterraneus TaxID=2023153 RepID=A0A4Q1AUZ7_9BACT|nr:FecR domain-containing protein [Halarcobacter mediterraneus]RXK13226.1 siderophore-interacting protein [Halarcobacter mediterraneus]
MNKQEKIEEQAVNWYNCNKEGLTPKQKKDFNNWLNENTEHKKAYDSLNKLQTLYNSLEDEYLEELADEAIKGAKKTKILEQIKSYTIAASFFIIIFTGLFQSYNYYLQPSYINSLVTHIETIKEFKLPDNTKLALDAKTKINIKYFHNTRKIKLLYGKVFFEVEKDKNRPFNIISNKTHIQVVGTSFEVENQENKTTIKVKEGIVKISKINDFENLQTITLLKKGQELTLNKSSKVLNKSTIDINNIALWKNNKLFFDNKSLKEAVKEFSKYTRNKITIESKDIINFPITGHFNTNEIDKFLLALKTIYPIKIRKEKNIIYINKKILD